MHLDVYGSNSEKPIICNALTYIATPNQAANTNWLGEAPCDSIARQIALARGPSGPNSEYLCNLADAMLQVGITLSSHSSPLLMVAVMAQAPVCYRTFHSVCTALLGAIGHTGLHHA